MTGYADSVLHPVQHVSSLLGAVLVLILVTPYRLLLIGLESWLDYAASAVNFLVYFLVYIHVKCTMTTTWNCHSQLHASAVHCILHGTK